MDDAKEKLIEFFKKERRYYSLKDLRKKFDIKNEEKTELFNQIISDLIADGFLFLDPKKGYTLFEYNRMGLMFGTLDISKNGLGFVHTRDGKKILIERKDLNNALAGDNVLVSNITNTKNGMRGEIYKTVKRNKPKGYFKVVGNGITASLIPYNSNYNIPVDLNKNDLKKLVDGEIIEVEIPVACHYGTFEGSFIRVVAHENDPAADIKVIASELDIDTEFSDEEIEELKNIPTEVRLEDMVGRVDLRDKEFITIDCDNTKDRDDAVCIEKMANGNTKLYVSIASVNHYIKMGSALFDGILRRCTSHYPNNTVMPMLPHQISNGICSLNEGVDRLTKTCEMEIDKNGNVVNSKVYNSVINSRKAMSYSNVNKLLAGEEVEGYEEYKEQLEGMQNLSNILSKASKKRKYLEFNIPEIEVKEENDSPTFEVREQGAAEKLIENFMVIADNTVAQTYGWLPFIFRTHDLPNEDLVCEVVKRIKLAGVKVPAPNVIDASYIKIVLDAIKDKEEFKPYNALLLRAMAKAKYSTTNNGHYALQLDDYCHFTSPIRRVADFMVHTIIDEAEAHNYDPAFLDELEKELYKIAGKASEEERKDKKLESEAKKMAMAKYMMSHLGETTKARIIDLYERGMFVRTDSLIDGRISLVDIAPDARYNPDIDAIEVPKSKEKYKIGHEVYVKAIAASKEDRTIDFRLVRERKKTN